MFYVWWVYLCLWGYLCLRVYVCICVYGCVCVCGHICVLRMHAMCVFVCVLCAYLCLCMCERLIYVCVCVCMCMFIKHLLNHYMQIHVFVYTYNCVNMAPLSCIFTCMYSICVFCILYMCRDNVW